MSTYRCSQCGCRIEVAEGMKIGTCPPARLFLSCQTSLPRGEPVPPGL